MLKKTSLFFVLLIALFLVGGTVWAGGGAALKGQHIILGSFWENYNPTTNTFNFAQTDDVSQMTLEWRKKIMKDNGFTMEVKQVSDWGGMLDNVVTSVMAGRPSASVYQLAPDWTMSLIRQNLAYPISDSKAVNLKNEKAEVGKSVTYNQTTNQIFTIGGKQYAWSIGYATANHEMGIYFNKRLYREAGLDPNTPYDMQKAGTWTWANFIDVCKKLTRDRNNTGRINVYAVMQDQADIVHNVLIYSNGAKYIDKDAQGRFVNASGRPEFMEALQYAKRLLDEGVMMRQPEGANWDWFFPAFTDGQAAMMFGERWRNNQLLEQMKDDWGFVFGPKGPRAKDYISGTDENVFMIPATFKPVEADAILKAIELWYTPVTLDWKAGELPYWKDSRAVDETLAMMRDPSHTTFQNWILIPGLQRGDIVWNNLWVEDPAQLVESVSQNWNALIADANNIGGRR